MKKICLHKAYSVRFRRWSRKGCAVLVSLRVAVTIGHVCRSIADAALGKNKSFSTANRKQMVPEDNVGESEKPDEGGGGIFALLSQAGNAVSPCFTMQNTVAVSGKVNPCAEHNIPIYNKVSGMGKTRKRVSPVPLFLLNFKINRFE